MGSARYSTQSLVRFELIHEPPAASRAISPSRVAVAHVASKRVVPVCFFETSTFSVD